MQAINEQNDNNDIEQGIPLTHYQAGVIVAAPRQSESLLPRLAAQKSNLKRVAGEASILDLSRDMYQLMLDKKYLSDKDIISLMRTHPIIRRTLISHLNNNGIDTGKSILGTLAPLHKRWKAKKLNANYAQHKKRILLEIFLAVFVIILFTSLSMDSFQVPYAATYFAMISKILDNATFCQVPGKTAWGTSDLSSLQLPSECVGYPLHHRSSSFPARATDAPADFWWATAAPLIFAEISARAFFSFTFKKNPLAKLISGGAFLAFGSVTMVIPYLVERGWPVTYAINGACDAAYQYAFNRGLTECPHRFSMSAFINVESISPIIPALGEKLSPYVIPALSLATIAGICFFGARRKVKIDQEIEFHLENELEQPTLALLEKPKESSRLL